MGKIPAMRSERRAARNRVYSLVGGLLVVVLCAVALGSLKALGRHALDTKLYPWPDKTLRALAEAEERFRIHDLDEDGQLDYAASLDELEAAGQITRTLAEGAVHGYRYEVRLGTSAYEITATPEPANSGLLHYRIDRSHVVRANLGGPATPASEIYWHPVYGEQWTGARPVPLGADGRPEVAAPKAAPAAPGGS
jgi:hypothetical protein